MPGAESEGRPLFASLVLSRSRDARRTGILLSSAALHGVVVGVVIAVIVFRPEDLPARSDPMRVLLYDPPPPPPPPMQVGSPLSTRSTSVKPAKELLEKQVPSPMPSDPRPVETQAEPEESLDQHGDEEGSDAGALEGMEGGVEGGQVGGVPGGVLGGVIGGTGDIVPDYDQAPRPITLVRPEYPSKAFTQKVEGTVEVEFIIGADGRVRRAWVVRSVPMLDEAAVQTVLRWIFTPAMKRGRPVATIARAPVSFHIF